MHKTRFLSLFELQTLQAEKRWMQKNKGLPWRRLWTRRRLQCNLPRIWTWKGLAMAKKIKTKAPARTCGECIHEYACAMWNTGTITRASAEHCTEYTTCRESAAYLVGRLEERKEQMLKGEKQWQWTKNNHLWAVEQRIRRRNAHYCTTQSWKEKKSFKN